MDGNKKESQYDAALNRIELIVCKTALKLVVALPASIMMATAHNDSGYYLSSFGWLLVVGLLFWDVLCCIRKS